LLVLLGLVRRTPLRLLETDAVPLDHLLLSMRAGQRGLGLLHGLPR
jgi:hypothetical protein